MCHLFEFQSLHVGFQVSEENQRRILHSIKASVERKNAFFIIMMVKSARKSNVHFSIGVKGALTEGIDIVHLSSV